MRPLDHDDPGQLRAVSDEELIGLMARRDEQALRELYRRYAPFLTALARRMDSGAEGRQIVEEAFVWLWDRAGHFDPVKSSARTWIVTSAHRLAINLLASRRVTSESLRFQAMEGAETDRAETDREVAEGAAYVSEALDRLDPFARHLLEMAYFGGRDHRRLAELSGRSPATVKITMRRALASLREALAEANDDA